MRLYRVCMVSVAAMLVTSCAVTMTDLSSTSAQASSVSQLGDLTTFKTTAVETLTIVEKRDLPSAKARIKDLETNWDSAEAGLKPRDAVAWHAVDKAIDRALTDLRASSPDVEKCKQSLKDLIDVMDKGGKS